MIEVREIKPEAWAGLAELFVGEFDSALPHAEFGRFLGVYEEGKLKAFVLAERVIQIGQICSVGDGKPEYVKALIDHLQEAYPPGISVATVASEPRFEKLYKSLGMERIPGSLWRRN